jgi:hypothetical protein
MYVSRDPASSECGISKETEGSPKAAPSGAAFGGRADQEQEAPFSVGDWKDGVPPV